MTDAAKAERVAEPTAERERDAPDPREVKAQIDERRVARGVAIGLPLLTLAIAGVVGTLTGPATAILVLAAGGLLGVVALFWASLRVLSGDVALPPEIEALDAAAHGVDALASRKKMLLRALKDLENERALGKLETEDFNEISTTYRAELKEVLRQIDASLEPFRSKADEVARVHLANVGLVDTAYRGHPPPESVPDVPEATSSKTTVGEKLAESIHSTRVECPKCSTSNEPDAAFCKKCGTTLTSSSPDLAKATSKTDEDSDEA